MISKNALRRQSRRNRVQAKIQSLEDSVGRVGRIMRFDSDDEKEQEGGETKLTSIRSTTKRSTTTATATTTTATTTPTTGTSSSSSNSQFFYIMAGVVVLRLLLLGKKYQSYIDAILSLSSFWFPLLSTLACVHESRHPTPSPTTSTSSSTNTTTNNTNNKVQEVVGMVEIKRKCQNWFHYWSIYGLVQTLDQIIYILLTKVVLKNNKVMRNNIFSFFREIELFFFISILLLNHRKINQKNNSKNNSTTSTKQLYDMAKPFIIDGYTKISEAVTEDKWERIFTSKTNQLLEIMVTMNAISRPLKDQAVIILQELRRLFVPAIISLLPFTPTILTRLGIIYTQFLLPIGKSTTELTKITTTKSKTSKAKDLEDSTVLLLLHTELQLHYLEYWILHSCFSIFLTFLDLFWWVPFYDHTMFLFWSYLSFDTTIQEYYNIFETDLISLGILHEGSSTNTNQRKVELHQTKTVQAFKAIAKRMPTADEEALEEALQGFGNSNDNDNDNRHYHDNGTILSKDQERAVAQLKSLIKQLPTTKNSGGGGGSIDDDDKTTQILEMLISQLSREEEKVFQEIERAFKEEQEEVVDEVVRVLTEDQREEEEEVVNEVATDDDDDDEYDAWMEDVTDYDHKGEIATTTTTTTTTTNITGNYLLVRGGKGRSESATSSDDEDFFFETTTGGSSSSRINNTGTTTTDTYKSSTELQQALNKVRERGGLRFPDAKVEHVVAKNVRTSVATTGTLRNRKKPKPEDTSLLMDIEKNYRPKPMPEQQQQQQRRLKTERETTSSFVTKLMTRMEQNQKHKRKEKREKLKEKRREKIGKQEIQ